MDLSTLNLDRLRKCGIYKMPPSYHLQRGSGNGCAGDPPGYPSYFTRCVYTQHGNTPPRNHAVSTVITVEGVNYIVGRNDGSDAYKQRLQRLYKPLPVDHPRVRLWILSTYKHHQHCYNGHGEDMVIFPVPDYKLKTFKDDERWNETYREALRFEVDSFNTMVRGQALLTCTPDNHNAVRIVRRYYPDHQPELGLIDNPPDGCAPCWWETEAENPGPECCNTTMRHYDGSFWKHPINGSWCQWCGWKEEEAVAA